MLEEKPPIRRPAEDSLSSIKVVLIDLRDKAKGAQKKQVHFGRKSLEHYRDMGEQLYMIKTKHLKHGDWEGWVEINIKISPRQARLYIRIYKNWNDLKDCTSLHQARAVLLRLFPAKSSSDGQSKTSQPSSSSKPAQASHESNGSTKGKKDKSTNKGHKPKQTKVKSDPLVMLADDTWRELESRKNDQGFFIVSDDELDGVLQLYDLLDEFKRQLDELKDQDNED